MKEYRKRNDSGAVCDDPRVAVEAGCFDEVGARAEAASKYKAIRHGVKSLWKPWRAAYRRGVACRGGHRTNADRRRQ
jgi:hypothetical protein